jgi:outer membrane autotransporter protein
LSSDNGLGVSTVGLRADKTLTLGEGVAMRVSGMAGWAHAFGDISPTAALAFNGGTTFDVAGTPIARDSAVVDLGVTIPLSRKVGLGATYSGKFSSESSSHDLNAKLSIRF